MISKKNTHIILCIGISIALYGCGQIEKAPKGYPDYSTPEAVFNTQFYALQHKDYDVMFEVSGEEYRKAFGSNREEQFSKFKKYAEKIKPDKRAYRVITNIEYGNFNGYDVKIEWAEKIGSRYSIRKSYMLLKKVGGGWRMAFPELIK